MKSEHSIQILKFSQSLQCFLWYYQLVSELNVVREHPKLFCEMRLLLNQVTQIVILELVYTELLVLRS